MPSSAATVVASVAGDVSKAAIFAYEQGASMKGYNAPDRRLFFFMDSTGLVAPVGTYADTSFSRAVCWAMRNCPTNRTITTLPINTQYCAGDSIKIRFTKTGTFNGVVPNKSLPANTIIVDNCQTGSSQLNSDGSPKFSTAGTWVTRTVGTGILSGSGCVGSPDYLTSDKTSGDRRAYFRPELPYKGRYKIVVQIPWHQYTAASDSGAAAVEVKVTHNGGTFVTYVNQRTGFGGSAKSIQLPSTFEFEKGPGALVEINNNNNLGVNVVVDQVQFVPDTLYPEGNIFTAQLSNAFGNFNAATIIGEVQNTDTSTIQGVLPANIASGTGYRIRVISSSPTVVGSDTGRSGFDTFTILGPPQKPGPITGPTTVCQNAGGQTYSIAAVAGADSLMWTRPTGASWEGGPTTLTYSKAGLSVDVNFGSSTGGTIKVQTKNACGTSSPIDGFTYLDVNVSGLIPNQPNPISGATTVCTAKTYTYTFNANDPKATHWDWTSSDLGSITFLNGTGGANGSNTVTVQFSGSGPKTLRVYAKGPCGTSALPRTLSVTIDNAATVPVLSAITAAKGICGGDSVYSVNPVVGAISYNWSYPAANTTHDGSTTNVTRVTYTGPVAGNIQVSVTDACGTSPVVSRAVNVTTDTSALEVNLGPDQNICGSNTLDAGVFAGYQWNTGATTQQIQVVTSGTYFVRVTDLFACEAADTVTVNTVVIPVPTVTDTVLSLNPTCGTTDAFLTATGGTGLYRWYSDAFAANLLDSTKAFIAKGLNRDTTFYVSSWRFGNPQLSKAVSTTGIMYQMEGSTPNLSGATVSVESWVKTSSTTTNEQWAIGAAGATHSLILGISGGASKTALFKVQTLPGNVIRTITGTTTGLNDGNWHHLAGVFKDDSLLLYVDGVLETVAQFAGVTGYTSARLVVGGNTATAGSNINGAVDEIRVWSTARTAAEILANKDKCIPGDTAGLMLYLNMENGVGSVDVSGNQPASQTVSGTLATGPLLACGICESAVVPLNVTLNPVSNQFTANDYIICSAPQAVKLTAQGGSGNYRWYNAAVNGSILDSSSTYTPTVTATNTYYVSAWDLGAPGQSNAYDFTVSGSPTIGIPTAAQLPDNIPAYTIEFWFNSSVSTWQRVLEDASNNNLDLIINSYGAPLGKLGWRMRLQNGSRDSLSTSTYITDGTWHHIALVKELDKMLIYVDGVLDASKTTAASNLNKPSNTTGIGGTSSKLFTGRIDEFRMWTTARTSGEINQFKSRCLNGNETGLKAYFKMEGNRNESVTGTASSGGVYTTKGPLLTCTLCETPRLPVTVTVETDPLSTGSLAKSNFCPGEQVTVPFAICKAAAPCAATLSDNFNDGALSARWSLKDADNNAGTGTSSEQQVLTLAGRGVDVWLGNNQFVALRRSDITGPFDVRVKIASRFFSNNGSAGIMIANDLTNLASGGFAAVRIINSGGNGVRFAVDNTGTIGQLGNPSDVNDNGGATIYSGNVWLRLVKNASNQLTAYHSANGTAWTAFGSANTAPQSVSANSQIALYFASGNGSEIGYVNFDDFTSTSHAGVDENFNSGTFGAAWSFMDADNSATSGGYTVGPQILSGRGLTFDGTTNEYVAIAHDSAKGDFVSTVKILGQTSTNGFARAGLFIANSMTSIMPGFAEVFVTESNGFRFRVANGPATFSAQSTGGAVSYPCWVRIVKTGTTVSGYYSTDGVAFTLLGSGTPYNMGTYSQVALYQHALNAGTTKFTVFDDYVTDAVQSAQYKYFAEFSALSGSFASPVRLSDTLIVDARDVCATQQGQVTATLPYPLGIGSGYRIRVVQQAPNLSEVIGDTSPTVITVPTNTWTGAVSTDWHNNGNWSCQIPDSTLNAIIPNVTNKPEILSGTAMAKQVTIAASSSLTLSPGAILGVWDHITNSGTFTAGANSTLSLNRSDAAQTITGIKSLANLVLNNPLGANMSVDTMTLSGSFTFQRGKFDLTGSKTIDLCSGSGAVTGMSPTRYFTQTDANAASGFLKIGVLGDGNNVVFPVGLPTTYNPATIANTGTATCMQVRVFGSVWTDGLGGTQITNNKFVNRTWEITPSGSGVNADITLQWNTGDEQATFDRATSFVAKNRGLPADKVYLQAGVQGAAAGSNPWTAMATGVTTFSKFTVTSDPQFLPIELLNFTGKNVEGNALLEWSTSYEAQCATYYIEKSEDGGETFQTIGEVACKNNKNGADYTFVDRLLTQNSHYRLRQVDVDGQQTFSHIIYVRTGALEASAFSLSPNPSTDRVKLSYGAELTEWDEVDMKVTTMQGVEVVKMSAGLSTLNKELNRGLKQLAGGMYIISLEFNDEKQHIKWTVLK